MENDHKWRVMGAQVKSLGDKPLIEKLRQLKKTMGELDMLSGQFFTRIQSNHIPDMEEYKVFAPIISAFEKAHAEFIAQIDALRAAS